MHAALPVHLFGGCRRIFRLGNIPFPAVPSPPSFFSFLFPSVSFPKCRTGQRGKRPNKLAKAAVIPCHPTQVVITSEPPKALNCSPALLQIIVYSKQPDMIVVCFGIRINMYGNAAGFRRMKVMGLGTLNGSN
ncbi:hypothetical protein AVEN_188829-1 [Araneus ventricosus]|uniref:Uncharacterized protein n=1 Tax=Araneus ventricosus TaxID=182803 RepID=A0A4Y2BS96_ARAVE|nr:hypothetical protein AVEN_188829-1 [Araneus ventricosus]